MTQQIKEDLHIEVQKNDKNQKDFLVTLNGPSISKKFDEAVAALQPSFKLAGFSTGKVPLSIIKRQRGEQVFDEVFKGILQETVVTLISKHEIKNSGIPQIQVQDFNLETEVKVLFSFTSLPEVPHLDFTKENFAIPTLELKVTPEDLKQAKEALSKMLTPYKEAEEGYPAKLGDAVIIDFHGKLKGEEFEGNKASQIRIDLGEGQFIKDFEEKLIGFKKGDEKTIKVLFPEDYNEKSLAGQEVDFDIKVHSVMIKDPQEDADLELQKRFNAPDMASLDKIIESKILGDFLAMSRLRNKKLLFDKIDQELQFEVPESMVQADFEILWKDVSAKIASGQIQKTEEEARVEIQKIALRRVKLGLLLADISRKESLSITEEEVSRARDMEKTKRPDQAKAIDEFFNKKENRDMIQGALLEEKVVDHLLNLVPKNVTTITSEEFNSKYAKEIQDLI